MCEASGYIWQEIVDAACDVICVAAKTTLTAAELALTGAQITLDNLKRGTQGAMTVLSAIAKGSNAFQLKNVEAGFMIMGREGIAAIGGSVHVAMDAKIVGRPTSFGVTVDFNSIAETARRIFMSAVRPLIDFFTLRQQRLSDRGMSVEVGNLTYDDDIDVDSLLADPRVRAFLANAQLFRVHGLEGGAETFVDLQSLPGGPEAFLGKDLEKDAWRQSEGFHWEGKEEESLRRARAGPIFLERIS